jgi:hypothetical protein
MDVIEARALAERHFGGARLGDARRAGRLVSAAEHILRHPDGSVPQKLGGGWAEVMGLYRLLAAPAVTHAAVFAPHRAAVLDERVRAHDGVVLLVHDATELNFSHVRALRDELGHVGSGRGDARGLVAHHALAVTPAGEVLGLAFQALHRRHAVDPRETRAAKRARPDRESRPWAAGCDATGPAPAGRVWVDVADRGADAFEFLSYLHARGRGRRYVIRSAKDRRLDGADHVGTDRVHDHLHAYARDLPELGRRTVDVSAQAGGNRAARRATVAVSAGPVTLGPNRQTRGEHDGRAVDLWVVRVAEVGPPPAGAAPLEWILLTDLPAAGTFAGACRAVDYYARRPPVEEFHKGLKTGLGVERLRFAHADRLEPAVGLLSVVAALLLDLRHAARRPGADVAPATALVPAPWVRVLSGRLGGPPRDDLSVAEFLRGVARLGGYLGRKADGPPGWLTLLRGWNDLQLMVAGAEALRGGSG